MPKPAEPKPANPKADVEPPPGAGPEPAKPSGLTELPPPGLPPKPTFPTRIAPDRYPDGAWSIAGLRNELDDRVAEGDSGTEIEVRAVVQEVYVPPPCPAGTACIPPKQPHAWLIDDAADRGRRNAMLVVDYVFSIPEWDAERWKDERSVVLEVGKSYTFKGKFRRASDTGFADERGLLELVAVQTIGPSGAKDWIHPPGAPWHPLERAGR